MVDYFDFPVAYDPGTDDLVADAVFEVFATTDLTFSTPLAVAEPVSGAAISQLRSSNIGVLPQFSVAGNPQEIVLRSGPFVTRATSKYGTKGDPGDPGDPGTPGMSAYQQAVAAGYEGDEEQFAQSLADVPGVVAQHVVSAPGAAPVVFHGLFAEGAEPTPADDGKVHIGWRYSAS